MIEECASSACKHTYQLRMDFIVGLETEFNELVEGGHLYSPHVNLSQVILPGDFTITTSEFLCCHQPIVNCLQRNKRN